MKFTLSWLKQFLDTDASLDKIAHTLTMIGLEVENIDDKSMALKEFEVAEVLSVTPHPNADTLQVCSVKTKSDVLQIVCGAPNARPGIKVVLANVGVVIPNGNFKIKKSQIRGVDSVGMLCSAAELEIGDDASGIIELDQNSIVGKQVTQYLGIDDPVLHINVTPNRADALGVYGIARDLAAAGVGTLKKFTIPNIAESFKTNFNLTNNDQVACPLFTIREIRNVENLESPNWLVNYLNNIGVGSISPLVDIANYIVYTFGQPMHVYDADKISGELAIDTSIDAVKFDALNNKEYIIKSGDIIIRDNKSAHCIAGIIGGIDSSCTHSTNRVILESAVFSSEKITRTGRRLQINTDSKYRFERNVDKGFTANALDLATDLILSICGGEASQVLAVGAKTVIQNTIKFPINFLKYKTGLDLSLNTIESILISLGFKYKVLNQILYISVPSWRSDVTIKEDIVEEILRIHGYEHIPETPLITLNSIGIIPKEQKRISDLKRLVSSLGYMETVTWSFMDSKKAEFFTNLREDLMLQNPISTDLDYMRPSIVPNLLTAIHNNISRSFHDISLFEVGPVFPDTHANTVNHICGIRVGRISGKNSHDTLRKFDVFDIKSDISLLLDTVGLDLEKCQIGNTVPEYYHPTRAARIALGKNILGYFGQVHPAILKIFGIETDVMVFELSISDLPYSRKKFGKKSDYIVSDYQKVTRDYAFIVDIDQPAGDILRYIRNINKKLIQSVDIFDIYSGSNIENGKKSIALSVSIQDNNKTLAKSDIETINTAIIDNIVKKFDATLRDS